MSFERWPQPREPSEPPPKPEGVNEFNDDGTFVHTARVSLVSITIVATISFVSCVLVLAFISYRFFTWRKYRPTLDHYNQNVILIYNLLFADLLQALSFVLGARWLVDNTMIPDSSTCFAQGFLLQMGDLSSAFFVLAIALHTWISIVLGRRISYRSFLAGFIGFWVLALLLTIIGPAASSKFYGVGGVWCSVTHRHKKETIALHYFWILFVQVCIVIIYARVFFFIRKRMHTIESSLPHESALNRITRYMVLYPVTYIILTLPLTTTRMYNVTTGQLPLYYVGVVGSMMASCGFFDCVIYVTTRRVLLKDDVKYGYASNFKSRTPLGHNLRYNSRSLERGGIDLVESKTKNIRTKVHGQNCSLNGCTPVETEIASSQNGTTNVCSQLSKAFLKRGSSTSLRELEHMSMDHESDEATRSLRFGDVEALTTFEVTVRSQ